jgi:hypothetical protein
MQPSPIQLLNRLAGASSPAVVGGTRNGGRQAAGATGADPFAALLAGAKRLVTDGGVQGGGLTSDRPVSMNSGVAGSLSLSPDQQVRLSGAIDQAEAAGVSTALVLIDGMAMVVDVGARQITRTLGDEPGVLDGIDGVVTVAPQTWTRAAGAGAGADQSALSTLASSQALLSSLNASAVSNPVRQFGRAS